MPARRRAAGPAFTVKFPKPLPAERKGEHWWMEAGGRELRLSNLDKVFWPQEGYTKGDILAYYYNVAGLIVPHLAGRPLTMKRMPDGVAGEFFYEKTAPPHTPDWIQRCPVESEDSKEGVIGYLMIEDTAGLLFVVNLGCVEFHPLHSRCATVDSPDYLFFDLDPFPPITFDDVLAVAGHVRAALGTLGLRSYPKTSGATGMQIYVPIEPGYTYQQVRNFVGKVGRMIERADPNRATMAWQIKSRTGKVFIDHNMNRAGANIAAAYSLRPEPGATVSTPLTWEEVAAGVAPQDFRIDNAFARFKKVGDLFEDVRTAPQDLASALEAVGLPRDRSAEVIARSKDPKLGDYLRKRDFAGTPEPAPGVAESTGNSFVIHKHDATRLHYDLRLERDGALASWAIPRGLPIAPGEKRLAVHVEDHPIEYGQFEGVIPKGHYGAGPTWIFDRGTYETIEWTDTKVSFRLHGERYRGLEWHMVKTKTDWLVFLARHQDVPLIDTPPTYQPMLAEGGWKAFDDPKWRFEPKLDGVRTLMYVDTDSTRLVSRTGRDQTKQYPELASLHHVVHAVNAVLDAEIVALADDGRTPSFERLQERINLSSDAEIKRARQRIPVAAVAFDILFLEGEDLTSLPLVERRERLEGIVERDERLSLAAYLDGAGVDFTKVAREHGLEGVVAKRKTSRYHPGRRTPDWRKIKLTNTQDCVILGWTPGQGGRSKTLGALLVGAHDEGELRWIGQVGTGFTDRFLGELMTMLAPLSRKTAPIDDPELAGVKGAKFVEPTLVCEVEYLQITKGSKLRAPSFKGLRQDKAPEDCFLERPRRGR
ncbi:MAG: non-homologous end-joining DNA ligase [Actinomycetota bacterium]